MNRLVAKYKEKGVRVVGLQCYRTPKLVRNNIIYTLESLKPDFPNTQSGWICISPTEYLPWAIVFDHSGKMVYGGGLRKLDKTVEATIAKAPHFIVGGPYKKINSLAKKIISDLDKLGKHVASLRKKVSKPDKDPEKHAESLALLACLEHHGDYLFEKARYAGDNIVESARYYTIAAGKFKGDEIGEKAKSMLTELTARSSFKDEAKADKILKNAQVEFRKLPPAGYYTYNIDYIESKDKKVLAKRNGMIFEYRSILKKIIDKYPETYSAKVAKEELYIHEQPK